MQARSFFGNIPKLFVEQLLKRFGHSNVLVEKSETHLGPCHKSMTEF